MEKKSILMLEIFSRRFPIVNMLNIVKMLRKSSNFRYPNGKETLRLRKNYSLVLYASCFQVRSYKKSPTAGGLTDGCMLPTSMTKIYEKFQNESFFCPSLCVRKTLTCYYWPFGPNL